MPEVQKPPVQISATKFTPISERESKTEFTITIEPGIAIYTNDPDDSEDIDLFPASIELLDDQGLAIAAKLTFPKGEPVEWELGTYQVYSGEVKVTAVFPTANKPSTARFEYSGYHFSGAVGSGYA